MNIINNKNIVEKQYKTATNLSTRISIHDKYSVNKMGFGNWIVSNYDIQYLTNGLFEFGDMKIENDNQIKMILDKVICLIGFFDLDPTRVLDITIEAFQNNPYNTNFLLLFNILNKKVLPHVIGFKLRDGNNNLSFFIVIAQMIKSGLIQI